MKSFRGLTAGCVIGLLTFTAVEGVLAQIRPMPSSPRGMAPGDSDGAEFYFTRLMYGSAGFSRGSSWMVDMPEAEHFFMNGIDRLTAVDGAMVGSRGQGAHTVSLEDGTIFDYPWLYAVEVGRWSLNANEIEILREYLLKGGFLMVDDFHGSAEWGGFVSVMQRVFPDRPIVDIPDDDEVFHVLYDLDQRIQIPGIGALYRGVTYEGDGYEPNWRGIYDDEDRLIVAINHNMDLGDAWEHADTPGYPQRMTALAYRFAVNYVIYSMTH